MTNRRGSTAGARVEHVHRADVLELVRPLRGVGRVRQERAVDDVSIAWRSSRVASSPSIVGWVRSILTNSVLPPGASAGGRMSSARTRAVPRILLEPAQELPTQVGARTRDRDDAAGGGARHARLIAHTRVRSEGCGSDPVVEPMIAVLAAARDRSDRGRRGDRAAGVGGQGAGRQRDRRGGELGRDRGRRGRPRADPGVRRRLRDERRRTRCWRWSATPRPSCARSTICGGSRAWGSAARRCRRSPACRG